MSKSNKIYLDYASSVEANPSSIHLVGLEARTKLQNARKEVAGILGARSEEIIFTSGGTESNNLAIQGVVYPYLASPYSRGRKKEGVLPHIITTNIEHPSVLKTFKLLEKRKLATISVVEVEPNGIVDPKKIKKEIKKNTVLVSVMYANNEIGTIQPIREIAKAIRYYRKTGSSEVLEHGYFSAEKFLVLAPSRSQVSKTPLLPLFHVDAVQAVNYLDLNVEKLGVDLLSLSGSKIAGAGRVGVLYKKKIVKLANVFGGGDQEQGLRPGTENLPEILKFSSALKLVQKTKKGEGKRLTKLRDYFINKLCETFFFSGPRFSGSPTPARPFKKESFATFVLNGDLQNCLPNIVNITFPKIPSDLLVIELSARGIMASSKSACESSSAEGSYVIKAIRKVQGKTLYDSEIGGVRFSFGQETTKKDIDYTIKSLSEILAKLKKWY